MGPPRPGRRNRSIWVPITSFLLLLSGAEVSPARASQDSTDGNRRAIQAYFAENAIEIETIDDFAPLFEAIGDRVFILGFATYGGRVIAASGWGRPMETMEIVPARPRSVEAMLREIGLERALIFIADAANRDSLSRALDHRAIGVLYRPPHEAYVPTVLPLRYDALMYLDRTRPLTPVGKP